MQRLYILLVHLLLIHFSFFGQEFGTIGSTWYYSEHAGGFGPSNSEYVQLQSVSDTIIQGKTTHKIIRKYYQFNGDTVTFDPLFVYEQSDTAFMYNNEKEAFQTIYIFNADEGDTITIDHPEPLSWTTDSTYRLVIEQIDTVLVDGIALKKYRTNGLDAFNFINNGGYFMDRIGGLDWFFPRGSITLESGGPIRCYTDNEIDTNFQSIACDYHLINNTTENEFNHDISVFPNPFQNQLIIQAKQPIQKSVLFDLSGRKIYVSAQKQLNLAHCKQGVYLLKIYLESGTTVNKTIVKHGL